LSSALSLACNEITTSKFFIAIFFWSGLVTVPVSRHYGIIPACSKEVFMALKVGQPAPDFRLQSHLGTPVSLSDYRAKNVVLAFFPAAWTPI
jgi:hypothetical protein